MKLSANRREPRPSSREVLGETRGEYGTLAERLEFVQAGDTEWMERIAQGGVESEWRYKGTAFASLHVVFKDRGISRDTQKARTKHIETDRWPYEQNVVTEAATGKLPGIVSITDLFNEAYQVFPFSDLLKEPLQKPSDKLWKDMVGWAKIHSHGTDGPSTWNSFLQAVDPERYQQLDLSEVRVACLKAIDMQRMKYPVTKDSEQVDLLKILARTRLIFPDMIGPASLKPGEQRAMYATLKRSRESLRWGTSATSFVDTYYHLALLEAPHLAVDARGIHLSVDQGPVQRLTPLPERSQM